jgi:hypothetical protein
MNRQRVSASSKEVATIIARYRASGLELKAFALEADLAPGRLHYWVYQKPGVSGRRATEPTSAAAVPVFQEVKLPSRLEWACIWAAEVGFAWGPGGSV